MKFFRREEDKADPHFIKRALEAFIFLVDSGAPIPDELLHFMADGAKQKLKDGTPWPTHTGRSKIDEHVLALVAEIDERFPKERHQIAEYLERSQRRVSQMIEEAAKASNTSAVTIHRRIYKAMIAGKTLSETLSVLEQVKAWAEGK
ncbi:hypothetical protein [Enterobacter roggenkampii]|uniref:hypothetical protein n=1 Tax=Enterobacter roggenkampii TaxID=1812935 RepID=UPI000EFAA960|nr:hypothetical protein [Enterobacter roggenkampii]BBS39106.1 hypothetical protein WP5S18E01_39530 [Enterobacter cloacae]HDR2750179.1 hypothetical protein [Enterobacter asburiae]MBW4222910.1 hypothetical protein [Enterobacter roggenkampii]MCK6975259.1 hypothetical protein [Enterobacter roggenkampii]MCL8153832.1 hypothetical protein [Enterobacter roggenkampii]